MKARLRAHGRARLLARCAGGLAGLARPLRLLVVSPLRSDGGNAIVEFVFLGVLLMIPLAYVILAVFEVQKAAYAVTSATREAGRAFVTAGSEDIGRERAYAAASIALRDHGLSLDRSQLSITCPRTPCLTPGSRVSVRLDTAVRLPLAPRVFAGRPLASVAVHGRHDERVDTFRVVQP